MSNADDGLRAILRKYLRMPDWLWTPIETSTISGAPDSYWAHGPSGLSGWVECKATQGWAVNFRPHQLAWLKSHSAAGVRCAVAIRAKGKGSGGSAGEALWLVRGAAAPALAAGGLKPLGGLPGTGADLLGRWGGPPAAWDWAAVAAALQSGPYPVI